MDNALEQYSLSREAASKLLKVSIRTIDRYLKSKKVSSRVVDGRIWLDRREVKAFSLKNIGGHKVDMSTSGMSTVEVVDKVDNVDIINQEPDYNLSSSSNKISKETNTFKDLFEKLKEELNEKQERLEIANYRVGQLECQVRNSIPLLEYHRENYERKKAEEEFKVHLDNSNEVINKLQLKVKQISFIKSIFLVILLILLALQPIWLYFFYKP